MTYTPSTFKEKIFVTNLSDYTLQGGLTASSSDNTIYFNKPVLDENGEAPTSAMPIRVRNSKGEYERMKIVAGSFDEDGLSATVVRGIRETGIDWSTTDESLLKEFSGGDEVICPVDAVLYSILNQVIEGGIATGGNSLIVGDETSDEIVFKRTDDEGNVIPCAKFSGSSIKFSLDGVDWIGFEDIVAGVTVKINASDITAKYLADALQAGDNTSLEVVDTGGGNYKIKISSNSQREGINKHNSYLPGYMIGGSGAETNMSLWDNISDGKGGIDIDGVSLSLTEMDFTSCITMSDVMLVVQSKIRSLTGKLETVVWDIDHIIISSVDSTSNSSVSAMYSIAGPGTDITGSNWLDADSNVATIFSSEIDTSQAENKVALIEENGVINPELINSIKVKAGEDLNNKDFFTYYKKDNQLQAFKVQGWSGIDDIFATNTLYVFSDKYKDLIAYTRGNGSFAIVRSNGVDPVIGTPEVWGESGELRVIFVNENRLLAMTGDTGVGINKIKLYSIDENCDLTLIDTATSVGSGNFNATRASRFTENIVKINSNLDVIDITGDAINVTTTTFSSHKNNIEYVKDSVLAYYQTSDDTLRINGTTVWTEDVDYIQYIRLNDNEGVAVVVDSGESNLLYIKYNGSGYTAYEGVFDFITSEVTKENTVQIGDNLYIVGGQIVQKVNDTFSVLTNTLNTGVVTESAFSVDIQRAIAGFSLTPLVKGIATTQATKGRSILGVTNGVITGLASLDPGVSYNTSLNTASVSSDVFIGDAVSDTELLLNFPNIK